MPNETKICNSRNAILLTMSLRFDEVFIRHIFS